MRKHRTLITRLWRETELQTPARPTRIHLVWTDESGRPHTIHTPTETIYLDEATEVTSCTSTSDTPCDSATNSPSTTGPPSKSCA